MMTVGEWLHQTTKTMKRFTEKELKDFEKECGVEEPYDMGMCCVHYLESLSDDLAFEIEMNFGFNPRLPENLTKVRKLYQILEKRFDDLGDYDNPPDIERMNLRKWYLSRLVNIINNNSKLIQSN